MCAQTLNLQCALVPYAFLRIQEISNHRTSSNLPYHTLPHFTSPHLPYAMRRSPLRSHLSCRNRKCIGRFVAHLHIAQQTCYLCSSLFLCSFLSSRTSSATSLMLRAQMTSGPFLLKCSKLMKSMENITHHDNGWKKIAIEICIRKIFICVHTKIPKWVRWIINCVLEVNQS